jgi:hypothetical protein
MNQPTTTVAQRVAMMNGARPNFTEYVDGLEVAIQDLLEFATQLGGFEAPCWVRAAAALRSGCNVPPARTKPLNCETNTLAMEGRVLKAARAILKRRNLSAHFEHGQWWVEHRPTGAQWSVHDTRIDGTDGFGLEQVTQGEEG